MTEGTLFSEFGTETSKTNVSENPMITIINEFKSLSPVKLRPYL